MTRFVHALLGELSFSFGMGWEILWALILGFALSGRRPGGRLETRDAAASAIRRATRQDATTDA